MNIEHIIDKLYSLSKDDLLPTDEFFTQIHNHITPKSLIKSFDSGLLYRLSNINSSVKIYIPCHLPTQTQMIHHYCEGMYSDTQIIRLPHDDINILLIDNYIIDGIIGGILHKFLSDTHFIQIQGLYFSPFNRASYIIMENTELDLYHKIINVSDVYVLLFQIAHSLYRAQRSFRFTHYNLHIDNITYQEEHTYASYLYSDDVNNMYLTNMTFNSKISDFAISRLETSTLVINSRYDMFPITTFGLFNPYYDFISLMGSIVYFRENRLARKIVDLLSETLLLEIFNLIFPQHDSNIRGIDDFMRHYYQNWRPKVPDIRNTTTNINQILRFLVKKLLKYNRMILENEDVDVYPDDINIILRRVVDFYPVGMRHALIDVDLFYFSINKIFPIRNFNYTHRTSTHKKCLIHIFSISTKQAYQMGYIFKSACCKIDPMVYMEDKFGVAMNAAFYDIGGTYIPLSKYRQNINGKYFETNKRVSPLYEKYYGYVLVDNQQIAITREITKNVKNSFMCGPLLVHNREIKINAETLENVNKYLDMDVKIFQCQKDSKTSKTVPLPNQPGMSTFNCENIKPGELSHGSNPNPRSMLILRSDTRIPTNMDIKGDVLFVVVEGRTSRSDGADLLDLVTIATELDAISAINLDGGSSSNIAWRSLHDPTLIETLYRDTSYPVGNILSLIKT